ncbi:alpha/beta hydrolase [Aestuariivita sp.]|jgi:pimeloyl-ACP methyl ester carboxylesterase|uniref:alpha/beta hydrolase n=1 Tax=Aestuariivita sp. TaxID=1872407 RepID=UPI00216CD53C|nr:alpha/beta hydrolase [Aestuariivita sp.]MCE8006369.1 alpha/beta hydrolase [Aestuariivita sp.]
MRYGLWLGLILMLAGCAQQAAPPTPQADPLLYRPEKIAATDRLVIFIPGALTSVRMFAPARGWTQSGFAPVFYRFPGLDGRPLTGPLDIGAAADEIAAFANAHPEKDVALVGYSSGAPIAILAAARITGDRIVPVAAISPAVERSGGLPTLARGAGDILRAAARAGTLERLPIWVEYWQILLYGRNATPDPQFRQRIISRAHTHSGERSLGPPDPNLARSHASRLARWELPPKLDLTHVRLRLYAGLEDPVFSTAQTLRFARKLGQDRIYGYPGEGHLLYLTQSDVFDTARQFADTVLDPQTDRQ